MSLLQSHFIKFKDLRTNMYLLLPTNHDLNRTNLLVGNSTTIIIINSIIIA